MIIAINNRNRQVTRLRAFGFQYGSKVECKCRLGIRPAVARRATVSEVNRCPAHYAIPTRRDRAALRTTHYLLQWDTSPNHLVILSSGNDDLTELLYVIRRKVYTLHGVCMHWHWPARSRALPTVGTWQTSCLSLAHLVASSLPCPISPPITLLLIAPFAVWFMMNLRVINYCD